MVFSQKLSLKKEIVSLYSSPYKAFLMIDCSFNYPIFNIIKEKIFKRKGTIRIMGMLGLTARWQGTEDHSQRSWSDRIGEECKPLFSD